MTTRKAKVVNSLGIHTRPASLLVKAAGQYSCRCFITYEGKTIELNSLINLMKLRVRMEAMVEISALGEGEKEAVEELAALIERGFEED